MTRSLAGTWTESPPDNVNGVQIDSREIRESDLFVGLAGENTHGQEFVSEAHQNGASAAIVEERQDVNLPQFVVSDSEETLQNFAKVFRQFRDDLYVIGITGSCGKTTVKEMTANLLEVDYEVGRTPGNWNNHLGVPLTILNEGGGEILVAELATNAPGEIAQLTDWVAPHYGVITHIGPAHLKGLGTLSQVALEKSDLLAGLPRDGCALVPDWIRKKDILLSNSSVRPKRISFEESSQFPVSWRPNDDGTHLRVAGEEFHTGLSDEAMLKDASLAVTVARDLGVGPEEIQQKMEQFRPLEGRGKVIQIDGCEVIDGSYNANPDSMSSALNRLAEKPAPRFAILGEMKELGDYAEEAHRELGEKLDELSETEIKYVGQYSNAVQAGSNRTIDTYESIQGLGSFEPGDFRSGLVKSSHGVGLYKLIDRWTE